MAESTGSSKLEGFSPVVEISRLHLGSDTGKRYVCPWNRWQQPSYGNLIKWKFSTDNSGIPQNKADLDKELPIQNWSQNKYLWEKNSEQKTFQVMWIGHATLLVQIDGITILTDPMFSKKSGPVVWPFGKTVQMGYERYRPPSCEIEELPKVDVVIISHDHFDHLDYQSVESLKKKFGSGLKWYVPEGLKNWFGKDLNNVTELTWWQEENFCIRDSKVQFVCVPSQHWCRRGPADTNKSLWCSWVVRGKNSNESPSFYFAGDTGYYDKLFKLIGEQCGPFTLAAIPIGAYEPRYITQYQHVDPEEAVKIHRDIRAEQSIGMHWGTFCLTNEYYLEPREKLQEEAKKAGLDKGSFVTVQHGEIKAFEKVTGAGDGCSYVMLDANASV